MYWLPYSSHTSHHPSQTPYLPWISYATQKLMLDSCKMVEKQSEAFHTFLWHFFPSLKRNFIAYRSSKVSDCIIEIHQLWQSGCSCWFEPEIIKIGQSSYKMYSNNILKFQVSMTILNACTKKVWKYIIVRFQFWRSRECGVLLLCHYSQVHSDFVWVPNRYYHSIYGSSGTV